MEKSDPKTNFNNLISSDVEGAVEESHDIWNPNLI